MGISIRIDAPFRRIKVKANGYPDDPNCVWHDISEVTFSENGIHCYVPSETFYQFFPWHLVKEIKC